MTAGYVSNAGAELEPEIPFCRLMLIPILRSMAPPLPDTQCWQVCP